MGALGDFLRKRADWYEVSAMRERAYGDYVGCGCKLMEILNNSNMSFLNKYSDISEICDRWQFSSATAFTFTLKTNKELSSSDIIVVRRYVAREMAKILHISVNEFFRHYFLNIGGDNLVIQKRVVFVAPIS